MKRALPALFAIMALTLTSGCWWIAAGAAGAVGYKYSTGKLEATADASVEATYNAAVQAVETLGLDVRTKNVDALTGQIDARTAQGKTVEIVLNKLGDAKTEYSVRVGAGLISEERTQATAIHEEIQKRVP